MTDWVKFCRDEAQDTFYAPLKEKWASVGDHIEKLEAALNRVVSLTDCWESSLISQVNEIAREALEGEDG